MSSRGSKSNFWSFTYNLKNDCDIVTAELAKSKLTQELRSLSWVHDAGFQLEKGLKSGRYHLQGWLKLTNRQYKSYLLNSFLNQGEYENCMHFERARNIGALVDYCSKVDATKVSDYWCKLDEADHIQKEEEEAKRNAIMQKFEEQTEKLTNEYEAWRQSELQKNGLFNEWCYCSEDSGDEEGVIVEEEITMIPKCRCHLNPNLKGVFTQYWSHPPAC